MSESSLTVDIRVERAHGRDFTLDVKFTAPPGVTILYGPSGSGKSTTLAAICGLLTPQAGRIALGDQIWFDGTRRIRCPVEKRGIAFVFQSLALFPHMTALANVEYGLPRKMARGERRTRAEQMLARMKVAHLAARRPATFSGGEAQRVALARAFAPSPRLVLLDEPFSAMDRELRRDFVTDVRAYVDEARVPLIHVTHHRNEARALADRVILIEAGRIKGVGGVDEMLPPSLDKLDDSLRIHVRE
ncbi:MAG TPA: ATP-binding cassette domain-containing protein [Polyangia bacterium]|jgi:molybdate transport system ATP-binding protein|nr:ATP-binding cassette domain-containing protein [Polyangia bacterium]